MWSSPQQRRIAPSPASQLCMQNLGFWRAASTTLFLLFQIFTKVVVSAPSLYITRRGHSSKICLLHICRRWREQSILRSNSASVLQQSCSFNLFHNSVAALPFSLLSLSLLHRVFKRFDAFIYTRNSFSLVVYHCCSQAWHFPDFFRLYPLVPGTHTSSSTGQFVALHWTQILQLEAFLYLQLYCFTTTRLPYFCLISTSLFAKTYHLFNKVNEFVFIGKVTI